MSRVSEQQHCVNNIAQIPPTRIQTQADRIRELMAQGYSHHAIVQLTGFLDDYVRAVRSRYNRRLGLTAAPLGRPPSGRRRPPRPPRPPNGQPQEQLRQLALTLYRWRQEGRFDQ